MERWSIARVPKATLFLSYAALTLLLSSSVGLQDLGIQRGRGGQYATKGLNYFWTSYAQRSRACRDGC